MQAMISCLFFRYELLCGNLGIKLLDFDIHAFYMSPMGLCGEFLCLDGGTSGLNSGVLLRSELRV
ncbi:hypothetical protein D3C73_1356200 [compost metagenome]